MFLILEPSRNPVSYKSKTDDSWGIAKDESPIHLDFKCDQLVILPVGKFSSTAFSLQWRKLLILKRWKAAENMPHVFPV